MKIYFKYITSPVGSLTLVGDETHLLEVRWKKTRIEGEEDGEHPILLETEKQLSEYFNGGREVFNLSINPQGTSFQKKVWCLLQKIPFAATKTYGELAKVIGNPNSSRAVGAANGKNPLAIIVPCHRVIGKNGDLTGFSGGLKTKEFLLSLERKKI